NNAFAICGVRLPRSSVHGKLRLMRPALVPLLFPCCGFIGYRKDRFHYEFQPIAARIFCPSSIKSTFPGWLARYSLIVSAAKCAVRSRFSRSFKSVASSLACWRFGKYKRSSAFRALIKPFSYASRTDGIARREIRLILFFCPGETSGIGQLRESVG